VALVAAFRVLEKTSTWEEVGLVLKDTTIILDDPVYLHTAVVTVCPGMERHILEGVVLVGIMMKTVKDLPKVAMVGLVLS
jgi:hypothetical protein